MITRNSSHAVQAILNRVTPVSVPSNMCRYLNRKNSCRRTAPPPPPPPPYGKEKVKTTLELFFLAVPVNKSTIKFLINKMRQQMKPLGLYIRFCGLQCSAVKNNYSDLRHCFIISTWWT